MGGNGTAVAITMAASWRNQGGRALVEIVRLWLSALQNYLTNGQLSGSLERPTIESDNFLNS